MLFDLNRPISTRWLPILIRVIQAGVVQRLNQYGLKYDDILVRSNPPCHAIAQLVRLVDEFVIGEHAQLTFHLRTNQRGVCVHAERWHPDLGRHHARDQCIV